MSTHDDAGGQSNSDSRVGREQRPTLAIAPATGTIGNSLANSDSEPIPRGLARIAMKLGGKLPVGAAVIFTGILGVIGNRWTVEILDAFDDIGRHPVAWHAVVFYAGLFSVAAIAVLDVVRSSHERRVEAWQRSVSERRDNVFSERMAAALARLEAADAAMSTSLERLQHMMQTLPDEGFLQRFTKIYRDVNATVVAILAGSPLGIGDVDFLRQSIRTVLNGVASLAEAYDGQEGGSSVDGPEGVYGANIMVFYPSSTLIAARKEEIRERLRFADPDLDIMALKGILDLRPDLSTSTDREGPVPDPGLRPLALPIPANPDGPGGRSRVQPGAPNAFVLRTLQRVPSGDDLIKQLSGRDLSQTVIQRITDHFMERAELRVRSFVSIPIEALPRTEPVDENLPRPEPLGVLNIHRSRPGILRDTNPEEHFTPVVLPILLSLSQLLYRLLDIESRLPLSDAATEGPPGNLSGVAVGSTGSSNGSEQRGAGDAAISA